MNIAALSMKPVQSAPVGTGSYKFQPDKSSLTEMIFPTLAVLETALTGGRSPGTATFNAYNAREQSKANSLQNAVLGQQYEKGELELGDLKEDKARERRILMRVQSGEDPETVYKSEYPPELSWFKQKQAERLDPDSGLKREKMQLDVDKAKREAANPLTTQQQTAAGQLRGEFISQSSDFVKVRDAYYNVKTLEKGPVGDIGLVFSYMKTIDPGSTVREGEQASVRNARNVPDQVTGLYNRVLNGLSLTDSQRDEIKRQVKNLYSAQLKTHKQREKTYSNYAKSYEIPEKYIIAPLYEIEEAVKPDLNQFEE